MEADLEKLRKDTIDSELKFEQRIKEKEDMLAHFRDRLAAVTLEE